MSCHSVCLEDLADWLDGRLDPQARRVIEAHLAAGCASCLADVAWLRRFKEAARLDIACEPPAELVARVKASYRGRLSRGARTPERTGLRLWPRLAPALGALLVLIVCFAAYLYQTPTVFARDGVLAVGEGTALIQVAGGGAWQAADQGGHLHEGDMLRAEGGTAALTLFDGTNLEVQPGAEVELVEVRSGLLGGTRQVALYQGAGTVQYDVTPLHGRRSAFRVQSPTGAISVQGTHFVVTVEDAASTRVTVLAGAVIVAGALDSALVREGETAIIPANARVQHLPASRPAPAHGGKPTPQDNGEPGRNETPEDQPGPAATKEPKPDHPRGTPPAKQRADKTPGANGHKPTPTPGAGDPSPTPTPSSEGGTPTKRGGH